MLGGSDKLRAGFWSALMSGNHATYAQDSTDPSGHGVLILRVHRRLRTQAVHVSQYRMLSEPFSSLPSLLLPGPCLSGALGPHIYVLFLCLCSFCPSDFPPCSLPVLHRPSGLSLASLSCKVPCSPRPRWLLFSPGIAWSEDLQEQVKNCCPEVI